MESPAAHHPSHPTERGGDPGVVPGALAHAQKKAETEGRTIVWVDEAGFYLLPGRVRTYAPRGQTPVLRVPLTRDHLSAISGITPKGKLLQMVQEEAFHGEDVVRFLRHLLRHLPGTLLVIWDGSPIHRNQAVKQFLAEDATGRVHLEQLPGYAPDLNADEGIWHYVKHVELRNVCCRDLTHLKRELHLAIARLRHKRTVIQGCIHQAGYL